MLQTLSNDLAAAVAAIAPHLLAHVTRRGVSTLFAVDAHHAIGSAHALRHLGRIEVQGQPTDAEVIGVARGLDLAVVRVDAELSPVRWAALPGVGSLVLPMAAGPRATLGLVSQVGGAWRTHHGDTVTAWLEVDGALPPGFSGGPLVAADGAVIGMNTRRLTRGGTTLPAATLEPLIAALLARGSVEPAYLGIGGAAATLTPAQRDVAGQDEALLVVAVEPGSPADGVLTVGDIVLGVQGGVVRGVPSLRAVLDGLAPGSTATIAVLAGGGREEREVTLGVRS